MLMAITGTFASGVSLLLAVIGSPALVERTSSVSSPTIIDTGYSSVIAQERVAQFETCYLLEKIDDTCVWEYNGLWIIGECSNPPSHICPRG